jgi:hypothetical protein
MCPKPSETTNQLSKQSHVEELEGFPALFDALTIDADAEERWDIFTFPIDFDTLKGGGKFDYLVKSADNMATRPNRKKTGVVTLNCTVAYMSQCMSWNKCKEGCRSMGASSYRWFHDGCCECVGHTCINYGINDSRCLECPEDKEFLLEDYLNDEDADFGYYSDAFGQSEY